MPSLTQAMTCEHTCLAASVAGGLGKTTMAKLLFNHLIKEHYSLDCRDFQSHAFLEIESSTGPADLQASLEKVLKQLGVDIISARPLEQQLQDFVRSRKVLYVLDNISDAHQLDTLLPTEFAAGSIVLVTSREKTLVLSNALNKVHWAIATH